MNDALEIDIDKIDKDLSIKLSKKDMNIAKE